ncbi:MAG TPA: sodium:solute symporter [Pirellulales bacterium]|jgi:SSS family solute:Na+ symporter/sodium/pantothenate symporter
MGDNAAQNIAGGPGAGAILALLIVIGISVYLGTLAQRSIKKGQFLKGYFLGNRGLGAWALALTATVQSGGTFMGYPSFVYSHGWVVAVWIGSYMVVPITGFGVLGKRFAQLSRRTGAITIPDLLRIRFGSSAVGLISSLFIILFMSSMMVAQFKAGAIVMKLTLPGAKSLVLSEDDSPPAPTVVTSAENAAGESAAPPKPKFDWDHIIGLTVFSLTVVGYTLIGGFLASVWTDLFQSILMFFGVIILFLLVVPLTGVGSMSQPTLDAVAATGPEYAFGPGYSPEGRQFLPVSLAFSFFVLWIFGGVGSPAGLVRLMASHDTQTIRRSIVLLSIYNTFIYLPLMVICINVRSIFPALDKPDEVIPRLALASTGHIPGGSFISGLILAAPFGAVMATVSTYLVVIASGVVRDVYLQFLRPQAGQMEIRRISQGVMIFFGLLSFALNIYPVKYLQALVVFSTSTIAATLLVPAIMAAYWRRATVPGAITAMFAGSATMLSLFGVGWVRVYQGYDQGLGPDTAFRAFYLLGLEPIVWGLLASTIAGVVVSYLTQPPDEQLVSWLFDRQADQPAQA